MTELTKEQRCQNYAINIRQCPCTAEKCARRGVCCECVANHASKGGQTACMKGVERPAETLGLPVGQHPDCANRERNKTRCTCGEVDCSRHGLCCDCIRYHWGHKTWPAVACM